MSTATVNMPVSLELYARLEQVAAHLEQPIETVLNETLRTVLPKENSIPNAVRREVEALSTLTTEELQQVANSEMSSEDQLAIEQLLCQQSWSEHFTWSQDGTHVWGVTPVGRATVYALKLNDAFLVEARHWWVKAGWHPPAD